MIVRDKTTPMPFVNLYGEAIGLKLNFSSLEKKNSIVFNSRWVSETRDWMSEAILLIAHSKRHSVNILLHSTTKVVKWPLHHVVWMKFLTNPFRSVYSTCTRLKCAKQRRFLGHIAGWQISNVWGASGFSLDDASANLLCFVHRNRVGKKKFLSLEWRWRYLSQKHKTGVCRKFNALWRCTESARYRIQPKRFSRNACNHHIFSSCKSEWIPPCVRVFAQGIKIFWILERAHCAMSFKTFPYSDFYHFWCQNKQQRDPPALAKPA